MQYAVVCSAAAQLSSSAQQYNYETAIVESSAVLMSWAELVPMQYVQSCSVVMQLISSEHAVYCSMLTELMSMS